MTQTALSPILPNEIRSEIWRQVPRGTIIRHQQLVLNTLRLVCRQWNTGVLSTHDLWSFVVYGGRKRLVPMRIMQLWFQRSGSALLDIYIDELPGQMNRKFFHYDTLYLIYQHAPRWRSLKLRIESEGSSALFASLPFISMRSLQSTRLVLGWGANHEQCISHIPDIPNGLDELTLCSNAENPFPTLYRSATSQWFCCLSIISVECPVGMIADVLTFFEVCTSKMRIALKMWERYSSPLSLQEPYQPVFLQNLLVLDLLLSRELSMALRYLHFPNLRILRFGSLYEPFDPVPWSIFLLQSPKLDAFKFVATQQVLEIIPFLEQPHISSIPNVIVEFVYAKTKIEDLRSSRVPQLRWTNKPYSNYLNALGWVNGVVWERLKSEFPNEVEILSADSDLVLEA